jgi:hypothetical protein
MELSPEVIAKCQQKALGFVLAGWGDLTYEQVLESLEADKDGYPSHPDIMVWQPFEDQWTEFLVSEIESNFVSFKQFALDILDSKDK